MRIAILTTDAREHFKDYGNPVPYFGAAPEALLQGFAQVPEVEIHVVSCIRARMESPEKLAPNIYFHPVSVPKIGWMSTLYQGCIRATRRKLGEIKPEIVHGQGTERDCAISAVFSGFPNVLTIHGNMKALAELHRAKFASYHWIAAKLETVALKKTGGAFCNSAYTEGLVTPRTKKTWRVPNALRQEFFNPLPPDKIRSVPVLLNIGVIQPRKRQLDLLTVAQNLHRRGLRFEMQFAGDLSPQTEYGAQFAGQLAEAEKIGYARHLGTLTTARLITAMDAASALLHFPSEEAFGLVVAEALTRNLKFFGAAVGGIVDITAGVEGAELFAAQDWAAMENAIARWIEAGCPRPGSAAVMRERYHPEMIARRHMEIYREVLSNVA